MDMSMSRMTLDFEDGIALLKFNHPEVMNAVGSEMLGDYKTVRQGLDWFTKHFTKEYMVLLD